MKFGMKEFEERKKEDTQGHFCQGFKEFQNILNNKNKVLKLLLASR